MQTNQWCLTLIYSHVYYDPIPVMKPQTFSRRINDTRLVTACHCRAEYETEYSASFETHTATSIDSANQKSIDNHLEELIDSSPDDWENDYYNPTMAAHTAIPTRDTLHTEEYDEDNEEERAIEYKGIHNEEDRLLYRSFWTRNVPSIEKTVPASIDTHHHQTNRKRASTDIACYPSIDTGVDRAQEGNYSIGSWADDRYHESYTVETAVHEPGAEILFMQQRNIREHQQRVTNKFYDTPGVVDDRFKPKYRHHTQPSIDIGDPTWIDRRPEFGKRANDRDGTRRFHWEKKDEYGV